MRRTPRSPMLAGDTDVPVSGGCPDDPLGPAVSGNDVSPELTHSGERRCMPQQKGLAVKLPNSIDDPP